MQQIQQMKLSVGVVRAGYLQTQEIGHSQTGMRIHNSQTIVLCPKHVYSLALTER